ncbi:MAG: CPBP family intramembrane metalloprotease [Anaeromicrobium sp.]|uniref:CPBP family intramembrane glutamic endopeptidase n=1 Tax=Anaeromicrobium sp. TaxID=1929132 RepID=UPI0025EC89CC|nr:type II CAAX endopeptidase family protein [Anaeromicrobium sp.]MCT4594473.1 CPBP family intramembrane metalloprotease [Anaeromicrobium sp.]
MKRYLPLIGNILKYCIITFLVQAIVMIGNSVYYAVKTKNKLSPEQLQNLINENIVLAITIAGLISFLIYILLLKNKEKNLWQVCNFEKLNMKVYPYIVGIFTCMAFISCSIAAILAKNFTSYKQVSKMISTGGNSIVGVICLVVFVPFFEEVLFRGLIYNELKKYLKIVPSIIIQGVIFALFHGNLVQGIYTFLLGITLALLYEWIGSIWVPIMGHGINNMMGVKVIPEIFRNIPMIPSLNIGIGLIFIVILLKKLKESIYEDRTVNII